MQPLFEKYRSASDASGTTYDALSNEALWQHDYTLPALNDSLRMVYENWWKLPQLTNEFHHLVRALSAVSPSSPAILNLEIDTTTEPGPELLAEWESRAQSDPKALSKIAKLYSDRQLFEPAIRCYSRSYDLSPSQKTTISLARAYRDNGQNDNWLPTLERYLLVEDNELGHSTIHRHIALDYLERCEWAQAEPHALESANTWSTMGLVTASRVYEGMQRWDESERWIREATVNYRTYNGMQWYLWCRRTGRGDLPQAKQYADDFMRYSWYGRPENGIYYPFLNAMIDERFDDALTLISQSPACAGDLYWQLQAATLAKQLGEEQKYQSSMKNAMDLADQQLRTTQPQLFAFAEILFAGREAAAYTDVQLADADKLLAGFSFADRSNCAYFLGEMLALQGDQKHAEKYWRIALESGQFDSRHATLAGQRLAERHGTSSPDKVESPAEPPAESPAEAAIEAAVEAADATL
jgi:tetratricopeptide (TPR) repeat protein